MKFLRRSSIGSCPSSRATASIPRSMASTDSGRPAPRYGPVGRDHAQAALVDANSAREVAARAMRVLARDPSRQVFALGDGHDAARLHRHGRHARIIDPDLHDALGFSKSAIDVAALPWQSVAQIAL